MILLSQWQESLESGDINYYWDGIEQAESCPAWLGQGQRRLFCLGDQLWIQIRNENYGCDWSLQQHHETQFPLTARFYLAGRSRVQTCGIADDYVEQVGQNYLYCLPDTAETETYYGKKRSHFVMIWLSPSRLRQLGTEHITSLAPEVQQFIVGNKRPFFHRPLGQTTLEMQRVLQRLWQCPYQGFTKQLYLESLALELLSLQLAQWAELDPRTQSLVLSSDDVERVHHASTVLTQCLTNPPSITQLARQVGLNDYKLKLGFRQVLGTTPFGYLRRQRLELAQQLLADSEMSVEQVAIIVGYKSRSSFTAAFCRQFGASPKMQRRQFYSRTI